ncbi:uncharacterized protein N7482_002511 [Penicillium canariense]|uniref:Uncharacterized protein n=1 Tax=Penicillium canariense TaxID=189055 RepID=A0A9W9IFH7_9EURO|nr:uncharacterized protein N7482_002511 [Penicillium canariense]KAJ5176634.1 hypothetical protein N7482_002511 [Penicillium canariense]
MADNDSAIHLQRLSRPPTESDSGHSSQDEAPRHASRHLPREPAFENDQQYELPAYSRATPGNQSIGRGHSTTLHRSGLITFLTLLFAGLAIYSWVILVILSFRPVSTRSWEANTSQLHQYPKHLDYGLDASLYRSARVIQSILSVIILPWTSAVCAHAAVIFVQQQKDSMGLTMRQVMTLADRRWLDFSLLLDVCGGAWKQHGSHLLLLAITLHFLGAIIYPIQSIMVNPKTIHTPVSANDMGVVGDLSRPSSYYDSTSGSDVVKTRGALLSADTHTWQPQLWQGQQGPQLSTFENFSAMTDPFYAQVPSGFHTGVLRQFAMRINSTASSRSIEVDEFPSECDTASDAFFANYSSLTVNGYSPQVWALTACMPNVTSRSPWSETRNRQEFSESLYLNISIQDPTYPIKGMPADGALYEINLRTTAGYFELPNYMNNGTPGALLENDPSPGCGTNCMRQVNRDPYWLHRVRREDTAIGNATNYISQTVPWTPLWIDNKGPLLTSALALFGPGSFLDTFFASFNVIQTNLHDSALDQDDSNYNGKSVCIELAPLMNLFYAEQSHYTPRDTCISLHLGSYYSRYTNAHSLVSDWLSGMYNSAWNMPNIFTTAAFLSNKQWVESMQPTYAIYQDFGSETEVPNISLAGLIVVTILLGPYLFLLCALSWYGSLTPRWTHRLDSFAMLRFGAALGEGVFPMFVARKIKDIKELDEIPGVIRDVGPVSDNAIIPISRLGLWEGKPLQNLRRYECYEADSESMTVSEHNQVRRGGPR